MRTFRPDVVNVHFPDRQIPFVLWLRRYFRFRLVVSLHGDEIERYTESEQYSNSGQARTRWVPRGSVKRMQLILGEADAVTACSSYLLGKAVELEASVIHKGQAIYNGVDLDRFSDKTSYVYPRPYILAYGRMTYKKGFDMLLKAFAQIVAQCPNIDIVLAGDGEERRTLQIQVQQLGIGERVRFFGPATPQEVVRLLNGSLGVIIPSRQEPFGIVAIEAMAADKPILATQVGGLVEILRNSGASFVDPTIASIRDAIVPWIDAAQSRESIHTLLPDRYDWRHITAQFEHVYLCS
jgi:glycosyltransferase involved in cell wall biosynthesis